MKGNRSIQEQIPAFSCVRLRAQQSVVLGWRWWIADAELATELAGSSSGIQESTSIMKLLRVALQAQKVKMR
jgi:hypothetical protein